MTDQNQTIISAPEEQTLKRKRGRPPKIRQSNESSEEALNVVNNDQLLGQTVSGVLNGSFDAGYFITVKPQNSNIPLTGLVFCPEKVIPVTPENDLAPKEIMYQRISSENHLDIQVPSTSASKSESKNVPSMVECDQENDEDFTLKGNELQEQGYEFQMASYYYPAVENLQDYRNVDHDEIMKEFETSACMNVPASVTPNLDSLAEMESVYPENLINESSQNKEVTAVDPCLKLMESVANHLSEAAPSASFDANERLTTDKTVRSSDLQLGMSTMEKNESSNKPSEQPFFFNLNDANKKSVAESLSFRLGDLQATNKPDDFSPSDRPVQEAVSSELKLSATVSVSGSNPDENMHDNVTNG